MYSCGIYKYFYRRYKNWERGGCSAVSRPELERVGLGWHWEFFKDKSCKQIPERILEKLGTDTKIRFSKLAVEMQRRFTWLVGWVNHKISFSGSVTLIWVWGVGFINYLKCCFNAIQSGSRTLKIEGISYSSIILYRDSKHPFVPKGSEVKHNTHMCR